MHIVGIKKTPFGQLDAAHIEILLARAVKLGG